MLKRTLSLWIMLLVLVSALALTVFAEEIPEVTTPTEPAVPEETYNYHETVLPMVSGDFGPTDGGDEYTFSVPVDGTVTFDLTKSEKIYGSHGHYMLRIENAKTGEFVYSTYNEAKFGREASEKTVISMKAGTYTLRLTKGRAGFGIQKYKLVVTCQRVFTTSDPYYFLTPELKDNKIYKDNPVQFALNVLPKSAELPKVTWSSSKDSVATVSANGRVTVKQKGKVTITAKFGNRQLKTTVTTVVPTYSQLKNFSLYQGQTQKLQITVKPADYPINSIKWKSSKPSVATVDAKGKVTAKKPGKTTITATINGKKISCKLTVKKVQLNDTKQTVYAKEKYQLEVFGGTGKTTWSSSDKNIASVNAKGMVTAKKPGKCTITARKNGKAYRCQITVKWPPETGVVKTVNIDFSKQGVNTYDFTLKGKSTVTITAKCKSEDSSLYVVFSHGEYDKWRDFVEKEDGKVRKKFTLEQGDCRLYYSSSSSSELTIKIVTKPQIFSKTGSNKLGKGYTLKMGAAGCKIPGTWSTSDSQIATVDSKGVVTGKKLGSCKIYYSLKDGTKLSYTVNVVDPVTVAITNVYNTSIYNECDVQFVNYTNKTIQYVEFNIKQYNYRGDRLRSPYDYYYRDDFIKPGEVYGASDYWVNGETKTAYAYILKVKFTDGTTWSP